MAQHNKTPFSAIDYDAHVRGVVPFYDLLHEQALDLVRTARPDVRVWLDTGCGTGTFACKAVNAFPNTRFVLADPDEDMSELTRKRVDGLGPDRAVVVLGPTSADLASHLPEAPQVITAILCHNYVGLDDRYLLTRTCHDLLDAGGVYVCIEHVRPYNEEALRIDLARWVRFQVNARRTEQDAQEHIARFGREIQPLTASAHQEILRSIGFRTVAQFWASYLQAGFYAIK